MLLSLLLQLLAVDGGTPSSLDDQARFIAGLPVDSSSVLAPLQASPAWQAHAQAMDAGWSKLESNRLMPMGSWAEQEITPAIDAKLPLVYLFGGPDAISVDVIYADAPTYVLAGLEKVGSMPPVESLNAADIDRALDSLRTALRTTIDLSFFVTSKVSGELKRSKLQGVLPMMALMLARHHNQLLEAHTIALDPSGSVTEITGEPAKHAVPGLRLRFRRNGVGPTRELFYFSQDVGNDALPSRPGLLPFLKSLGPFNSFFKAASFILHDRHFSKVREALLEGSQSILQDDSGMPFKSLPPSKWALTFFGQYTPQTGPFADHFQTDLKAAFDAAQPRPLPFRTGYKHEVGSTMMLARKKQPEKGGE